MNKSLPVNVCHCSILWRPHERCHSRLDVPVLWPGFLRTEDPEVPVVEEVLDHHPDGEILWLHHCLVMVILNGIDIIKTDVGMM